MDCLERKMDRLSSEVSAYQQKCLQLEAQNANLVNQLNELRSKFVDKKDEESKDEL